MLQTINGKRVFVVEFDTMPELPITGLTQDETMYANALRQLGGIGSLLSFNEDTYSWILTQAIETGVITEPGKYGLYKDNENRRWEAFKIVEE